MEVGMSHGDVNFNKSWGLVVAIADANFPQPNEVPKAQPLRKFPTHMFPSLNTCSHTSQWVLNGLFNCSFKLTQVFTCLLGFGHVHKAFLI